MKRLQDDTVPKEEHYIRFAQEVSLTDDSAELPEEMQPLPAETAEMRPTDPTKMKIIVCMHPKRSQQLLDAQYLQSDISYKRVVGWKEFELAGKDRLTGACKYQASSPTTSISFLTVSIHLAVVYCRIYLTRESAAAHRCIFHAIRRIVHEDTSQYLKYRHLHSPSLQAPTGVLHWVIDQDGGQAKGLFVFLPSFHKFLTIIQV